MGPTAHAKKDHEVALAQKLDTMHMPSGRKDLTWLARATEARQVLKEFWNHARSSQRTYLEAIRTSDEDIEMLFSLVSFDLAPEHHSFARRAEGNFEAPSSCLRDKEGSIHLADLLGPFCERCQHTRTSPPKERQAEDTGSPSGHFRDISCTTSAHRGALPNTGGARKSFQDLPRHVSRPRRQA